MLTLKQYFKRNTHNNFFKVLAGFGRSLNRLYENRNHDKYSNGEVEVLKKVAKINPTVIIDGGANVGGYAQLANQWMPNAKIYSFEPVKNTFQKLTKNVKGIVNIVPIENGLFNDNCSKEINIYPTDTHSSIYEIQGMSDKSNHTQTISLIKGDDFLHNHNISEVDLLKIDVEGAEYETILGFDEHIKNGKIKAVQFEYGYINITTNKLLIDFYNYFESNGYLLGKIFPKTVEFRKYEYKYEDFLGPNYIAVKKTETELINLLMNK